MAAAGNRYFILIRGAAVLIGSKHRLCSLPASRSPLGRSGKPNHNSLKSFGRTVIDIKTSSYMCLDDADHLNA